MAQTPANPELKLENVATSEETLFRCIGKLTYTSAEALRSAVPETKRLVLDLKDLTYMDSFGPVRSWASICPPGSTIVN